MSKELDNYIKVASSDNKHFLLIKNVKDLTTIRLDLHESEVKDVEKVLGEVDSQLARLQAIKEAKPSEALENLNKIGDIRGGSFDFNLTLKRQFPNEYETIKQALTHKSKKEQALDVIKKKKVNVQLFIARNYKDYADYITREPQYISEVPLAYDEFELLKEVLK